MKVSPNRSLDRSIIALAIVAPVLALATMALMPPAQGAVLLVPVWAGASPIRTAFALAVPVIARGPGATVIVYRARDAALMPMMRAGLVPIAAPAALCGDVAA